MNTVFDSPVWRWVLQKDREDYSRVFDTQTPIFVGGRQVAKVQLVPPLEAFGFVESLFGLPKDDRRYTFRVEITDKSAYLFLVVDGRDILLFRWVPSKAPVWLKRYMNGGRS